MIHGRDGNIKQRMVVCAFVLLFAARTNVDLVHTVNSPSELLSARPIIIRLTSVFAHPITSNTGGNQDTPAWRRRLLLNPNDLWFEGRKAESSGGGRGSDPGASASDSEEHPGGFLLVVGRRTPSAVSWFRPGLEDLRT